MACHATNMWRTDVAALPFLQESWGQMSAREIAQSLDWPSRDSVIGKAHRLKLSHKVRGGYNGDVRHDVISAAKMRISQMRKGVSVADQPTMNFSWQHFEDGEIRLCHPKGYPFGLVKRRIVRDGFTAILLEPGMPSVGPVESRKHGAEWLRREFLKYYPTHSCDAPPDDAVLS